MGRPKVNPPPSRGTGGPGKPTRNFLESRLMETASGRVRPFLQLDVSQLDRSSAAGDEQGPGRSQPVQGRLLPSGAYTPPVGTPVTPVTGEGDPASTCSDDVAGAASGLGGGGATLAPWRSYEDKASGDVVIDIPRNISPYVETFMRPPHVAHDRLLCRMESRQLRNGTTISELIADESQMLLLVALHIPRRRETLLAMSEKDIEKNHLGVLRSRQVRARCPRSSQPLVAAYGLCPSRIAWYFHPRGPRGTQRRGTLGVLLRGSRHVSDGRHAGYEHDGGSRAKSPLRRIRLWCQARARGIPAFTVRRRSLASGGAREMAEGTRRGGAEQGCEPPSHASAQVEPGASAPSQPRLLALALTRLAPGLSRAGDEAPHAQLLRPSQLAVVQELPAHALRIPREIRDALRQAVGSNLLPGLHSALVALYSVRDSPECAGLVTSTTAQFPKGRTFALHQPKVENVKRSAASVGGRARRWASHQRACLGGVHQA